MEIEKLNHFKEKLVEELALLEKELEHVGKKRPLNGEVDWEGKPADFDTDSADESELGDKMEEYEENTAIVKNLEIRYNEVKKALQKIEAGTYGTCEVNGEAIEEDRLEANPAATTCKAHMN
ncbi:MAG TPA: TraR/DksA C4-type zinc finger protein [Candidatus Paceibacterota bacterium]